MTPADPVVVCCPNGHQLNAERAHLGRILACPVCGRTFRPAVAPGLAGPPATAAPFGPGPVPAPGAPRYTPLLLGLWIAFDVLVGISNLTFDASAFDAQTVDPAATSVGCLTFLVAPAAIVFQLLWIHRLHRDALTAGGYTGVSPGLALGLSFIPVFNFVWTSWTLRKLGAFALARLGLQDRGACSAFTATSFCFGAGILRAAMFCVGMSWGAVIGFKTALESGGNVAVDPSLFTMPGYRFLAIVSSIVGISTTLTYTWTAAKLQAVLYRTLSTG